MKHFLLSAALLMTSSFAFGANHLEYVKDEYNHNIYTANSVTQYLARQDVTKGEALKNYFKENKVDLSTKMPAVFVKDGYLTFDQDKKGDFKMKPLKNGDLEVFYKTKKGVFKSKISFEEFQKEFNSMFYTKHTTFLSLIIPEAQAEGGIGEAVGIGVSGVTAAVMFGGLYAVAAVADTFNDIPKSFKRSSEAKIRKQAMEACDNIQGGKKVSDAAKLRVKIEKMKAEDECVAGWEAVMWHSCAWYDQHIACLASADEGINGATRAPKAQSEAAVPVKETKKDAVSK